MSAVRQASMDAILEGLDAASELSALQGDCCISRGGLNRAGHVAVCQAAASNRPAMNAISPLTPGCL